MKKILPFIICLCILLAGCSTASTNETQPATTQAAVSNTEASVIVPQQETMYAVSVPVVSENTRAEDGTVIFSYTYQDIMLTLQDPDVADKVITDFRSRIKSVSESANSILASAKANYNGTSDWTPYLFNVTYSPMRVDQGVLSLFGNRVAYSGASHPERLSMSANYDLVTGDVLTLGSIMSAEASTGDFCNLVLNQLSQIANAKYLYEGYEDTVRQRFSKDESQDEDWYFSTNGLCFYFVPYEIAPYSSGVIIAEIPYSELAGLLYDGYFPAERDSGTGTIYSTGLNDTDTSRFTQIAELVLNSEGQMAFLHTEGILWNVKIEVGAWDTSNTEFTSVYTALHSSALSPGDAIMLQTDEYSSLRLSYYDGTQEVVRHFNASENGITLIP